MLTDGSAVRHCFSLRDVMDGWIYKVVFIDGFRIFGHLSQMMEWSLCETSISVERSLKGHLVFVLADDGTIKIDRGVEDPWSYETSPSSVAVAKGSKTHTCT